MTSQQAPLKVIRALKTLRDHAAFKNASFGFNDETLTLSGRPGPTPQTEWTVDAFIKERTRIYRQSWLLPQIDELIKWAEGA